MLVGDVVREDDGLSLVDHLGLDHDAHLATCLDGVGALDALVGVGDFLKLLEALDIGVEGLLAGTRAGGRHGIRGLDEHVEDGVGLNVGMVRLDGVHDLRGFAETAREIGADDSVAALDLVVDGFAEVVQQAGALGGHGVRGRARRP